MPEPRSEFATILELSAVGLTRCSADLRYLAVNAAYARMAGVDREKIIGRPIVEVMGEKAFAIIQPYVAKVLSGQTVSYEAELEWGSAAPRWHQVSYRPDTDAHDTVVGWVASVIDITERKLAEAELASDRQALLALADATSALARMDDLAEGLKHVLTATIALTRADKGNVQLYDRQSHVLRIVAQEGFDAAFLQHFAEVTARDGSTCAQALLRGERVVIEDIVHDQRAADIRDAAAKAGYRAVQSTPLLGRDGQPLAVISTHYANPRRPDHHKLQRFDLFARAATDFIERCHRNAERDRLLAELNHRVKNTLATVLAIANRSIPPSDQRRSFERRMASLANTHTRLSSNNWAGASLRQLLEGELAAYKSAGGDNLEVSGPDVTLSPRCALTLTLAIHELATNAAKHGSLSAHGKVSVAWSLKPDGSLFLQWRETGGPRVTGPQGAGFGRQLIEHGLAFELEAAVHADFRPEGLVCSILIPGAHVWRQADEA